MRIQRPRLAAILLAALLPFIVHAQSASGYKVNGTDLDSIFAPYHAGWPQAAATGFKVAGVDLNSRYAPLSTGTAAAATKFKTTGGVDLNAIFAALGTTGVKVGTQPSAVSGSTAAGYPSGTVTSNSTTVAGSKGSGSYSFSWHIASGTGGAFTNASGASTAVTDSSVPAGSTVSGTMFCTISDGVSSVNTSSVAWSLQNTTPPNVSVAVAITAGSGSGLIGYSACSCVALGNPVGNSAGQIGSIQEPPGGSGALPSGKDIIAIGDFGGDATLIIWPFNSANPGQSSLISVTLNGVTFQGSAATFTYGGTVPHQWAQWTWSGKFNLSSAVQYSGTVVKSPSASW